jgi:hypothetical protein
MRTAGREKVLAAERIRELERQVYGEALRVELFREAVRAICSGNTPRERMFLAAVRRVKDHV